MHGQHFAAGYKTARPRQPWSALCCNTLNLDGPNVALDAGAVDALGQVDGELRAALWRHGAAVVRDLLHAKRQGQEPAPHSRRGHPRSEVRQRVRGGPREARGLEGFLVQGHPLLAIGVAVAHPAVGRLLLKVAGLSVEEESLE